jgi:hypothetical protein
MKKTRRYLLFLLAVIAIAVLGVATASSAEDRPRPVVHTDGHLRPGHFETIWVNRFPGRGRLEVSFLPTASCEFECASYSRRVGFANRHGRAKLHVRVPQTFIDENGKHVPFRNHERIELEVEWTGPGKGEVVGAEAEPEPVIIRTHKKANA